MLTNQQRKTIKSHKAYNYNVAREPEANATIRANADGTFTLDIWGVHSDVELDSIYDLPWQNITLSKALDLLLTVNNDNEDYCVSWYIGGL